jgi:hypothetical protein
LLEAPHFTRSRNGSNKSGTMVRNLKYNY